MDGSLARALLGVPAHAPIAQIRRAFRGAARVAHPDRGGSAAAFRRLVTARDVLLAQAGRPAVANPYRDSTIAPEQRFSATDIHRVRPVDPSPARPRRPATNTFDDVLASVLAEAA